MSNKYEVTKDRILDAASKCNIAKATLKVMFPEAFKSEMDLSSLKIASSTNSVTLSHGASLQNFNEEIGRILSAPVEVPLHGKDNKYSRLCVQYNGRIVSCEYRDNYDSQKGIHYLSLYNKDGRWIINNKSEHTMQLIFVPNEQ